MQQLQQPATAPKPPLPPGPKGHWLLGSLSEFHRDITGFYTNLARTHGDVAGFWLGNRRMCLVSHPDLIEQLLVGEHRKLGKLTYVLQLLVPLLGKGLLTNEGDSWLRQRRLIQPVFLRQRIQTYADTMVAYTQRAVAGWQAGEQRDVYGDMVKLTLEIVAKVLFDADVANDAPDVGVALEAVMHNFLARWGSMIPLPAWVPTPSNLRFKNAIARLDRIVYRFIAERHAAAQPRDDLLTMLLQARDEDDGSQMTDKQLRDEVMTLFLAGHETTATALSWTWYLLAQHPEVMAKLQAEVRTVLGDRTATAEDAAKLTYTEHVITEGMRLYPPAYAFARVAREDLHVGGYRIVAGTTILFSEWVVQRDPRFFSAPERFWPERWADGLAKRLPRFAYFPFGGGQRICIGNTFAMLETVLVLATMLQHVTLELAPDARVKLRPAVTLRPEHGIAVVVRR